MPESENIPVIVSRQEALAQGLKRYFTGAPCIRGHVAEKFSINGRCIICAQEMRIKPESRRKIYPAKDMLYSGDIISRNDAINSGSKFYFTGLACAKGHVNQRLVSCHMCLSCQKLHYDAKGKKKRTKSPLSRKEYHKQWTKRNEQYLKEKRLTNRDEMIKKCKNWREKNPEKVLVNKHLRAKRYGEAEGVFTKEDLQRILLLQKYKCAICRSKLTSKKHLDHIIALSKGGTNWARNLQFLCAACNIKKHNKDPIDFMQSLGYLL